jgi:hypothetical protein
LKKWHRVGDENFAKTTIEMVALVAEEEREQEEKQRPARRRRRWFIGSLGLLSTCLAGFVAVWAFWPDPDQEVIDDLPVLERLDEYLQIDDIEFLELLDERQLFPTEVEDDSA